MSASHSSNGESGPPEASTPTFWCDICGLDLQSAQSHAEHIAGRKHQYKLLQHDPSAYSSSGNINHSTTFLPPMDEEELFEKLACGAFQVVVVLTGAGVSTAAGVPDFRSPGGLFETIRQNFGERFPHCRDMPEYVLSRQFKNTYSDVYEQEVEPMIRHHGLSTESTIQPTVTHHFCAWLHRKGWLRRVYTQNVDGLHLHPTLTSYDNDTNLKVDDKVIECHGNLQHNIVLYGDPLPQRMFDCCSIDFDDRRPTNSPVDLLMVFGSSLQVAPFCAIPNLAPKGCARVLVNRCLDDCKRNDFSPPPSSSSDAFCDGPVGVPCRSTTQLGSRKNVPLRSLWWDRKARKRWRQLLVEDDCDNFVCRFFESKAAKEHGHSLKDLEIL